MKMNSLGPFARHPSAFRYSGYFVPDELEPPKKTFAYTNMGLQITLRVKRKLFSPGFAILACRLENQYICLVAIKLLPHSKDSFTRHPGSCLIVWRHDVAYSPYISLRFLTNNIPTHEDVLKTPLGRNGCLIRRCFGNSTSGDLTIWDVEPSNAWDSEQRIFSSWDQSHIVLHVKGQNGDGYAIILEYVHFTKGWNTANSKKHLANLGDMNFTHEPDTLHPTIEGFGPRTS
jgi:hypothetical protein